TMVYYEGNESSDAYCSSDDEELGFVDFHTEADGRCAGYNTKKRKAQKQLFSTESDDIEPKDGTKKGKSPQAYTKSPQTTTNSSQTTCKSGEGCYESSKWTKSRVASDRGYSNPGSTCRLDDEKTSSGNNYFKRIYVCFKGVMDGWLAGCRKVLLNVVSDWLPNAEHRKCIKHAFANFKKKFSGVQLARLFWHAASTTLEQRFYSKMEEMKVVSQEEAYEYLI
ncbi:hypothetical protein Tco_0574275, partial [Tanacetum coccineum]